jgi:hypothetical protein
MTASDFAHLFFHGEWVEKTLTLRSAGHYALVALRCVALLELHDSTSSGNEKMLDEAYARRSRKKR